MTMDTKILEALKADFPGANIDLDNESYKHAGHAGDDGSGQTHYVVHICSPAFIEKSRLQSQRMVMDCLKSLIGDGGIHALSVKTTTPK